MTLRSLPTGGNPISPVAIFKACKQPADSSDFLSRLVPHKRYFRVSSGSAGLRLALEAMKINSRRKEVILPGYSCPSVLAAVINAGLKPVLCDMAPASFRLSLSDLHKKISPQTLAVIVVHLFGLPDRIQSIKDIAKSHNVMVLEDAAQALGSHIDCDGRYKTGELGDLSVFSFGQGKPFSLLSGGAVIANNAALTPNVARIFETIPEPTGPLTSSRYLIKLGFYSFLFHPLLFWLPQRLPFLHIGETVFTLDLDYGKMLPLTVRLGQAMVEHVELLRSCRQALAGKYADQLKEISEHLAHFPSVDSGVHLLRFPLIFRRKRDRDACLEALLRAKLGASGSYPCPLNGFPAAVPHLPSPVACPNALEISRKVLTLPLHPYVRDRDVDRVAGIVRKTLGSDVA